MPMHMQCPNVVVGVDAVALVVALWCGVGLGSGWSDRKAATEAMRPARRSSARVGPGPWVHC